MSRYNIHVPDRQLACVPVRSPEGRAYLVAMAAAANYGRANRQLLTEATRRVFEKETATSLDLLYYVSHNLAARSQAARGRRRPSAAAGERCPASCLERPADAGHETNRLP